MSEADGPATEALRQLMAAFGRSMTEWAERVRPQFQALTEALADPEVRAALAAGRTQPSITCPVCRMTSYNPGDIREGYCGNCHAWTSQPRPAG